MHTICLIKGDGIGAEVIPAAQGVLAALGLPLHFEYADAGFGIFEKTGNALPAETLQACERADAILFGATQSPMGKVAGYSSPILTLRRHFDLYANLRPALQGEIDLFIVRENTEGLYSRIERVEDDGQKAITERVITAAASRRIVQKAAQIATSRPRKRLTIVHKANVLKETCGLFRAIAWEVVKDYPELEVDEVLVDACAMYMVMQPLRFDVIVTTNLFGDILSDLAAGLTGGLGVAPSANVGDGKPGVYEPVHGSAPDIAGKGIADPRAALLSSVIFLDNLGYIEAAAALRRATYATTHTGNTEKTARAVLDRL